MGDGLFNACTFCFTFLFNICDGLFTLGDGVTNGTGIVSVRFKILATSRSAFLVLSPTFKDKVVVEGGSFKIDTISIAACRRKSSIEIFGNRIVLGKNVTVSTSF